MPKSNHSHSPLPVDEPPSKRYSNHVFWADTGESSKQADDMVDSTRARILQPGYAYDSSLSPSEDLFATGYSCNFLAEHQLRDCFSVGEYSNLSGNINDSVGRYGAICCPVHGWSDDDSAMDLRGDNMTTLYNLIDSAPLLNKSIGGEIQASTTGNYTNILPNSIPSATGTPDLWKILLDTTYPVVGGGLDYGLCTPPVQIIPDTLQSVMAEAGTPTTSMSEANSESPVIEDSGTWWQESSPCGPAAEQENLGMMQKLETQGLSNSYELGIKPTTSKQQMQHIDEAEQVSDLWRHRNHVDEALHDLRKLEGRLQGWNKHQMVAVTSTG